MRKMFIMPAVSGKAGLHKSDVIAAEYVDELKEDIQELKHATFRTRTFYLAKFQRMREKYEQRIQALAMTLSSNAELWEKLSEMRERERLSEDELGKSLHQRQACEAAIDSLRARAVHDEELRRRLVAWKLKKGRRLEELEVEVDKYERIGGANVDRLLLELQRRDAMLMQLRGSESVDDRLALEREGKLKELAELKAKTAKERKLTARAMGKLELIQAELEKHPDGFGIVPAEAAAAAGLGNGSLEDTASRAVGLWRERQREAAERVIELQVENATLKARIQAAEQEARDAKRRQPPSDPAPFATPSLFAIGEREAPGPPAAGVTETYRRHLLAAEDDRENRAEGGGAGPLAAGVAPQGTRILKAVKSRTGAAQLPKGWSSDFEERAAFSIGLSLDDGRGGLTRKRLQEAIEAARAPLLATSLGGGPPLIEPVVTPRRRNGPGGAPQPPPNPRLSNMGAHPSPRREIISQIISEQ